MLKPIVKFIRALNGNTKKSQIAAGFSWGLLLALLPAGNFFWLLFLVVSFFFNHNHGAKILSMAVFKLILPLAAGSIDFVGWEILNFEALYPIFTTFYNMPFVPFTGFNNTLVAGGLAAGIILWVPVFFLMSAFISFYRKILAPKIAGSKAFKAFSQSPLVSAFLKAYRSVSNVRESL